MLRILELNHVALHVSDVERSCRFYSQVLMLPTLPRPAFPFPGAWFGLGTHQELHLIGERQEPVHSGNRSNHFALRVQDLEAWEAHLQQCGIHYREPRPRPDGAMQLFLRDPDGHVIELLVMGPAGEHGSGPS